MSAGNQDVTWVPDMETTPCDTCGHRIDTLVHQHGTWSVVANLYQVSGPGVTSSDGWEMKTKHSLHQWPTRDYLQSTLFWFIWVSN